MGDYVVLNDEGAYVTTIEGDQWCWAMRGRSPINEACGGCQGCELAQAQYAGLRIIELHEDGTYKHYTDGRPCWCDPEVEVMENGNKVIIHREEQ